MPPPGARSRARSVVRAGALLLFVMLLGGCLLPPDPKTDAGQDVFNLYILVLALAAVVFVGVEGFILYAIVRYRRQPGDDALPEQHHGNTKVEIVWTAIPSVIVLVLFVMSVITLGSVEARSDQPGVTIEVVAKQWTWDFRYPEGVEITGSGGQAVELPLPVGEPVRLVIISEDVNHAFFVPEFLIKRDAIDMGENAPPNEIEFTVTEAGTYAGQCAEFCGVGHNDMIFEVNAMARADYDVHMAALAAGETPPPPPQEGECEVPVQIKADNTQFDIDEFEVPVDTPFCIEFENLEDVEHNVSIYPAAGGDPLFRGEFLNEAGTITYSVPALPAGDYEFVCDAHPQTMVGDVILTDE